jgi:hypothetical protein
MRPPIGAARSVKGDRVRMPTCCSVCSSSQQAAIDRRLLAGESLATLSVDDGLPVRELRTTATSASCSGVRRAGCGVPFPIMD